MDRGTEAEAIRLSEPQRLNTDPSGAKAVLLNPFLPWPMQFTYPSLQWESELESGFRYTMFLHRDCKPWLTTWTWRAAFQIWSHTSSPPLALIVPAGPWLVEKSQPHSSPADPQCSSFCSPSTATELQGIHHSKTAPDETGIFKHKTRFKPSKNVPQAELPHKFKPPKC